MKGKKIGHQIPIVPVQGTRHVPRAPRKARQVAPLARDAMHPLREALTADYRRQLESIGRTSARRARPFSKRQLDQISAGFDDGVRSAIMALQEMGCLVVLTMPEEEQGD